MCTGLALARLRALLQGTEWEDGAVDNGVLPVLVPGEIGLGGRVQQGYEAKSARGDRRRKRGRGILAPFPILFSS